MTMMIECPRCGHTYEVTPEDIRSGLWRRRGCPVCKPGETEPLCDGGYPMHTEQDAA